MKGDRSARGQAIAAELRDLIEGHRAEMLALGAVARPLAEGLVEVKALEDAKALARAKPRWRRGELISDPEANREREDAMARRLAEADERFTVVILGGGHDLTEALSRHAPGVRYLRVWTDAYREMAGE